MRYAVALLVALGLLGAAWAKADTPYRGLQVAIVNQSATVSAGTLAADLPWFQQLVDTRLGPAWNLQAHLYIGQPRVGSAAIFLQDTDFHKCQCFGYHDWRQDRPVAYVYAADSDPGYGGPGWAFVLAHELEEMLVDPSIDRVAATRGLNDNSATDMWMVEVADPVVDATIKVGPLALADFVLPAWYEPGHLVYHHRYDAAGVLRHPVSTTANGYAWRFQVDRWAAWPPQPGLARLYDRAPG